MKINKFTLGTLLFLIVKISSASETVIKSKIRCHNELFGRESAIQIDIPNKTFEYSQIIAHSDILKGAGYIQVFYINENLTIVDLYEQGKEVGTLISIENESWSSKLQYRTRTMGSMNCRLLH